MTSQTSTLTKVAGASGISRRALNVASACRAFSPDRVKHPDHPHRVMTGAW
jgi:hypothetical protein